MDMISVDSEAVSAIGYENGTLSIAWRNGKTYTYQGVPVATYQGLMAAESKGKFIAAHIRKQHAGVAQ
jgi:hypothetical protein